MAMSLIWVCLVAVSFIFSAFGGNAAECGSAALSGAGEGVKLCFTLLGPICLWSGVNALLERAGAISALSRVFRPLLRRVFPSVKNDREAEAAITANFSANLLGLGNAATPAGIRAAKRLSGGSTTASNELCRLVVLNTASVQLIPTTVCALRAAAGAKAPFDILPAVWLTSVCSVLAGLLAARFFEKLWKN